MEVSIGRFNSYIVEGSDERGKALIKGDRIMKNLIPSCGSAFHDMIMCGALHDMIMCCAFHDIIMCGENLIVQFFVIDLRNEVIFWVRFRKKLIEKNYQYLCMYTT